MKIAFLGAIILSGTLLFGQSKKDSITISGYGEAYYTYDFNQPKSNARPGFIYNFNRHNEFNINLAYVKINYMSERVRGNIALGTGSYMNANYAAEPGVLKNIFEANIGYKLNKNANIWLDIGVLPSHIGFESAIGKDAWTLTRSLAAENSPYFESGLKLSYTTPDYKLTLAALALNGWQRITRLEGNSLTSWGTQVYFKPSDTFIFNYSAFMGTDKPDSARVWRFYHNIYAILMLNDKFQATAGVDIGTEGKKTWYTPVGIIRYTPFNKWGITFRSEYFKDPGGVIITTGTPKGFSVLGNSLNIDYTPADHMMIRLEGRIFNSKGEIFQKNNTAKNYNSAISFSTAFYF